MNTSDGQEAFMILEVLEPCSWGFRQVAPPLVTDTAGGPGPRRGR